MLRAQTPWPLEPRRPHTCCCREAVLMAQGGRPGGHHPAGDPAGPRADGRVSSSAQAGSSLRCPPATCRPLRLPHALKPLCANHSSTPNLSRSPLAPGADAQPSGLPPPARSSVPAHRPKQWLPWPRPRRPCLNPSTLRQPHEDASRDTLLAPGPRPRPAWSLKDSTLWQSRDHSLRTWGQDRLLPGAPLLQGSGSGTFPICSLIHAAPSARGPRAPCAPLTLARGSQLGKAGSGFWRPSTRGGESCARPTAAPASPRARDSPNEQRNK